MFFKSPVAPFLFSSLILRPANAFSNMSDSAVANETSQAGAAFPSSSYTQLQCDTLAKALPGKVSLPSDLTYQASTASYFSQQEEQISPSCIVTPVDTSDVATAVNALASVYDSTHGSAKFAVKGGGHTPWAGSASIQGGAVVDMTSINTVTANADGTIISVGAGARWTDVYTFLDSKNLALSGGRAAQVGVGGLTLGGRSMISNLPYYLYRVLMDFRGSLIFLGSEGLCLRQCRKLRDSTR